MTAFEAPDVLEKLGRLFMVGLPGKNLDASTRNLIQKFGINNFIIFKRNVTNPEQLKQLTRDLCRACQDNRLEPPLIAIDQEGGTVTRLPPPFTQFSDARVLAESPEPEKALIHYARVCARELKSIGINYNLAPVLDVCEAGKEFFMERRSLGADAGSVARLGSLIIREMQANGIAACAKHFPGLGAAVVDPHIHLPSVAKAETEIRRDDLEPFRKAMEAGVASVMTSHTVYQHLDSQNPATLSKKILSGLLRHDMKYEGVVITDDLEMGAIENEGNLGDAALQAFAAGADLLLVCHSHEKAIAAYNKIAGAGEKNPQLQTRISASVRRVSKMGQKFAGSD